jgi:hypothetical protein
MTTAAEFRKFAEECLRWAQKAKTTEEKKTFLDMAQTWVVAAAKVTNGRVPEVKPPGDAESKAITE